MPGHRYRRLPLVLIAAIFFVGACNAGPSVTGSFDRDYTVSGPLRLELTEPSGDVDIRGSADGKVHVHGEVRASGFGFDNPQKRLDDTLASPPIEQKGDTLRIGTDTSHLRHISISYTIHLPHETEVDATVASGAQTIRDVRGPVKVQAASGSIRVEKIERGAQLTTASGAVSASDVGGDLQIKTASGSVNASDIKGDVSVIALSGVIHVVKPGTRVEAGTASGEVEIQGASSDVKAHAASGRVSVQGNPSANSYWDLKTASGAVELSVPPSASFHLTAEAVAGDIRTDIPIVVEEQGKHSLRAHMGAGGGRVEVHTVSGEIRVASAK